MWNTDFGVTYFFPDNYKYSPSVAIFSLWGTLVEEDEKEEVTVPEQVLKQLRKIHEHDSSIVIISNQTRRTLENAKTWYKTLTGATNVPIGCIFSFLNDRNRKPMMGMFELLEEIHHKQSGQYICRDKCILVGRAGGQVRKSGSQLSAKTKTEEDYDRAFAENINIMYVQPKLFFGEIKKSDVWKWGNKVISPDRRKQIINKNLEESRIVRPPELIELIRNAMLKMAKHDNYVVLFVGLPCSGKTTELKKLTKYFEPFIIITDNEADYLDDIKIRLHEGKHIFIDRKGMEIFNEREKILEICDKYEAGVIIVNINITVELCMLFDHIRVQRTPNIELLPETAYTSFLRKYQEPAYKDENNIKVINMSPYIIDFGKDGMLRYGSPKK